MGFGRVKKLNPVLNANAYDEKHSLSLPLLGVNVKGDGRFRRLLIFCIQESGGLLNLNAIPMKISARISKPNSK